MRSDTCAPPIRPRFGAVTIRLPYYNSLFVSDIVIELYRRASLPPIPNRIVEITSLIDRRSASDSSKRRNRRRPTTIRDMIRALEESQERERLNQQRIERTIDQLLASFERLTIRLSASLSPSPRVELPLPESPSSRTTTRALVLRRPASPLP